VGVKQVGISVDLETGGIGIRRGIGRFSRHRGPWQFLMLPGGFGLTQLKQLKLDGVIARMWSESQARLQDLHIPLVDVSNATLRSPFGKVILDNAGAGRRAAEHLLGLGLRYFLAIDSYAHEGFELRASTFRERVLACPGCTCASVRSFRHPHSTPDSREVAYYADAMKAQPRPLGVYAVNDIQATSMLEAARRADLSVPDEVAVIGTDNAPEVCDLTDPPLSSVEMNFDRVGYEAAKLLACLMEDRSAGQPQTIIVPPGEVVTRVSTDVLAIDDPDIVAAARYIRTHATDGIDVSSVLDVIAISRRRLERRFLEVIGRGVHDEIQRVRIAHSKRLLVETDLSMLEIALASGFTSQSYFGRAFRRAEGVTPTNYRKKVGRG
jgi:LacI family transcriptional regulator